MKRATHSLLRRQLKRYFPDTSELAEDVQTFFDAVNDAYWEFDDDREMLERSLDLSSQELLQANAELQVLINAFPDLFLWIDSDGVILNYKEGSVSDLVIEPRKLAGKNIQNTPLGDVGKKFQEAIDQLRQGKQLVSFEYSLSLHSKVRYYEARMLPLMVDQFLCIIRNISEAKEAEHALVRREEEFRKLYEESRKAEEVYRSLLHSSADAIVMCDLEDRVTYVSPAFSKIFGWSQEELEGQPIPFVPSTETGATAVAIAKVVREGIPIQGYETKRLTKDGRLLDIGYSASRFNDHRGQPAGTLYVLRDITEKKSLEARYRKAEKMEAIGTLAGGVAHDLNNILGGLVSYPELLLLKMAPDDPMRKNILTMQASGQKAAAIVQDMLTLARRGVAVSEVVSLNEVVEEYLESPEYHKLLKHHPNVLVETELESGLDNLLGSSLHLSKTIMNLVANAAEAMPEGGTISITTQSRYLDKPEIGYEKIEEGDYVTLTVQDTGTGIVAENLERIFEPFYTQKVMGRSGTGLGMSVIWGTVKDHNGFIDLKSADGVGTSFVLYFPLTRLKRELSRTEEGKEDYRGHGEAILVVDDIGKQLDIASDMLTQLGYAVATANSGEEAVEYLRTHQVDLVVLDMIMDPGIDGLETYRRILQLHPGQKAIITSGYSESVRVKKAQQLGAGAYVRKPYMLKTLGVAVQGELQGSGVGSKTR